MVVYLNAHPNSFAIHPKVNFVWQDLRWKFIDDEFLAKREEIGLHTHLIHFHSAYYAEDEKSEWRVGPIMQFYNRDDLLLFKLTF